MTPTLFGRWQTRIFLLVTIGVFVSLPFVMGWWGNNPSLVYFWVLLYVGLFGLGWDCIYQILQQFLWDHDWPGALQFITAITEAIFLIMVINVYGLPHITSEQFHWDLFLWHYSCVWIGVYLSSWVIMRLFFPRWRFRGGQWIGRW